ncbi:MAG: PilN domain-containing protein [Elainellaceae cyanobacterium]
MYGLDINFLNDRTAQNADYTDTSTPTVREQSNWRPAIVGAIIGLTPLVLVGAGWLVLNSLNSNLEARRDELEAQLVAQRSTQQELDDALQRAQQAEDDAKALVTVFDEIKPWSALLQSIQDSVPSGVQISGVEQGEGETGQTVIISGFAVSFDDVSDFVLVLKRSPFVDADSTNLESASLTDYPVDFELPEGASSEVDVRVPQVVEYSISANLTDLPASQLLAELESTLAVGLTSRIQALRDRGAFE